MKKTLAFVVLTGLLLTGCGSKQASAQSAASPSISAAVAPADSISVPAVIGMTLDKATNQLQELGLKVKSTDIEAGKAIVLKGNWQVATQGPTAGTTVAKGSTVELGVKHITDATPTPTPTQVKIVEAPPAAPAASEAPPVVADPPAYVAPAAPLAPAYVPPAPVQAPPVYGGIICKDGYAWPGTTRQGACHGHGGIRN